MNILLDDVRNEIINLHDFFVSWFNGTVRQDELDSRFLSRLDKNLTFIAPEGSVFSVSDLATNFQQAYGINKEFRIQIRDVKICQTMTDHILVTYTEWQVGAKASEKSSNARITSALLTKTKPFKWLHIQETWLPESVRSADSFNF